MYEVSLVRELELARYKYFASPALVVFFLLVKYSSQSFCIPSILLLVAHDAFARPKNTALFMLDPFKQLVLKLC